MIVSMRLLFCLLTSDKQNDSEYTPLKDTKFNQHLINSFLKRQIRTILQMNIMRVIDVFVSQLHGSDSFLGRRQLLRWPRNSLRSVQPEGLFLCS